MTRNAKVYTLLHIPYKEIQKTIENHTNQALKNFVAIYTYSDSYPPEDKYIILSLSDIIDKIVESGGAIATEVEEGKTFKVMIERRDPVYGSKLAVNFL